MNYLLKVYFFSRHKKTSETGLVVKDARLFICFDFLGKIISCSRICKSGGRREIVL